MQRGFVRALWAGLCLVATTPEAAHAGERSYVDVGPSAGVSVNNDQWVVGGFGRLGGLCPFACIGDFGVGLRAHLGIGGNRATVRSSLRIDDVFWFGRRGTVGLYPTIGVAAYTLVPVGRFAEFCGRTQLEGCGGTYFGAELGGGLRLWPVFIEAVAGTGQIPAVTITAGVGLRVWESGS